MTPGPPVTLDQVLESLRAGPSRTGSVIATVYGDAVLPRGGTLALADLLVLMRRLGASDGVVRTAVYRLARDGLLHGRRAGRHSAYGLTERAEAEFRAAIPRIYWTADAPWDGRLRLAFPEPGTDRSTLEAAGFALLSPGVLVGPHDPPAGVDVMEAEGLADTKRALAARAWPLDRLAGQYRTFVDRFGGMTAGDDPLDAMALRTMLIHEWRRIALRDPRLPAGLLPDEWPGHAARAIVTSVYAALAPGSEQWLDQASTGSGPLPAGPDPALRFSGGGTPPAAPASSPGPAGSPRPPRSAST